MIIQKQFNSKSQKELVRKFYEGIGKSSVLGLKNSKKQNIELGKTLVKYGKEDPLTIPLRKRSILSKVNPSKPNN